jgi:hypothetical protein
MQQSSLERHSSLFFSSSITDIGVWMLRMHSQNTLIARRRLQIIQKKSLRNECGSLSLYSVIFLMAALHISTAFLKSLALKEENRASSAGPTLQKKLSWLQTDSNWDREIFKREHTAPKSGLGFLAGPRLRTICSKQALWRNK